MSVRFGRFVFDEPSRQLSDGGRRVPLTPKAFELLALLLEARPRALSKAELKDRLWPDTFVGETSLPRVVGEIRRALGEPAGQATYIRTVHRFGYAFGAGVEVGESKDDGLSGGQGSAETSYALLWGDRIVPLGTGENIVGRDPECVLRIPSGLVSRRHARIAVDAERTVLQDLGSKNGTLLHGRRIAGEVPLSDGDEIRIGPALLVFCVGGRETTRSHGKPESPRRR